MTLDIPKIRSEIEDGYDDLTESSEQRPALRVMHANALALVDEVERLRDLCNEKTNEVLCSIDQCNKLLDNGWNVLIFKNALGSYSSVATKRKVPISVIDGGVITDHFTVAKSVAALTEKVFGTGAYTKGPTR